MILRIFSLSAEVGLYVDGVGYSAAMFESSVGGSVDEAHGPAVRVFVGYEVESVAPLPEVWSSSVGLRPCFYCRLEGRGHPVLSYRYSFDSLYSIKYRFNISSYGGIPRHVQH